MISLSQAKINKTVWNGTCNQVQIHTTRVKKEPLSNVILVCIKSWILSNTGFLRMMRDNVNDNAWRFNYIVLQDPEVEEVPMFSEQNQDGSEMLDVRGKKTRPDTRLP